jgi:HTH-type transcriptional regulator/antitoxin HigA
MTGSTTFGSRCLHEFCHVALHLDADRYFIVDDLEVKTSDDIEAEADKFAREEKIRPWRL